MSEEIVGIYVGIGDDSSSGEIGEGCKLGSTSKLIVSCGKVCSILLVKVDSKVGLKASGNTISTSSKNGLMVSGFGDEGCCGDVDLPTIRGMKDEIFSDTMLLVGSGFLYRIVSVYQTTCASEMDDCGRSTISRMVKVNFSASSNKTGIFTSIFF